MTIRPYAPADLAEMARLFTDTVTAVNCRDYTPEQIRAWAGRGRLLLQRNQDFLRSHTLVAEDRGRIVGYGNLEADGYLDQLFVHRDRQGEGIAGAICNRLEDHARQAGLPRVTVHASITARPFFIRRGYGVTAVNQVPIGAVTLQNYSMEKIL